MSTFKPVFDGYFKIFLHDDDYKKAADRAEFTEDWRAGQKRGEIMRRERKFQVALHIFDTDGDKRGHTVMGFKVKGGQRALSKVIFGFGNDFVDELRAGDERLKVDLTVVIRYTDGSKETMSRKSFNEIIKD